MTSLKAGSLGRFAAGLGASMATDDPEIVDLCGDFGFNLFTYLQLVDDLRDAFRGARYAGGPDATQEDPAGRVLQQLADGKKS